MIATNLVRDHWRKTGRERRAIRTMTAAAPGEPAYHPAQDVDVRALIEGAAARLRSAFLLHYYAGFGVREVAAHAGTAGGDDQGGPVSCPGPAARQRWETARELARATRSTPGWTAEVEPLPPPPGTFERSPAGQAPQAPAGAAGRRGRRRHDRRARRRAADRGRVLPARPSSAGSVGRGRPVTIAVSCRASGHERAGRQPRHGTGGDGAGSGRRHRSVGDDLRRCRASQLQAHLHHHDRRRGRGRARPGRHTGPLRRAGAGGLHVTGRHLRLGSQLVRGQRAGDLRA